MTNIIGKNDKLKIGIITTHSFPIDIRGTAAYGGDVVIMDLARSLSELGHTVSLYAPEGTYCPHNVKLFPCVASYGKSKPLPEECDQHRYYTYINELRKEDIVHDFSITKYAVNNLYIEGYKNVISTTMGGPWYQSYPPRNLIVWSKSYRDRILRGATDYENSPLINNHVKNIGSPVKEAKVVHGAVDTDFYTPTYKKDNYFLWMNRWNEVKGYQVAIELAKYFKFELVMAGLHPNDEMFEYQKKCALHAIDLAKGCSNIKFEWIPDTSEHHIIKRELYRKAKTLLYTVRFQEPFGLSQVEALACGTPVIGFDYGSVSEVIENGITGFVCQNRTSSISPALNEINNINPYVCRENAVRRFDRKVMAKNYLEKYQEIINGNNWG